MLTLKLVILLNVLSLALANPTFGLLASLLAGGVGTPPGNWRLCGSFPSPNRGQVYTNGANSYYCPSTFCVNLPEDCCGYFGRRLC